MFVLPVISVIMKEIDLLKRFAIEGEVESAENYFNEYNQSDKTEEKEVLHYKLFSIAYSLQLKKTAFEKNEGYEEIGVNSLNYVTHEEHKKSLSEAGKIMGSKKSEAKKLSSRENGKKGGRPKKNK